MLDAVPQEKVVFEGSMNDMICCTEAIVFSLISCSYHLEIVPF
jgi:hypothetical protein